MRIQVPAEISSLRTLADHTLRLTVDVARELEPTQSALIFALRNMQGWFLFQVNEFTVAPELPPVPHSETSAKTHSQRLRAVLYRLWEQTPGDAHTAEEFYASQMEKIIAHFKEKIDA